MYLVVSKNDSFLRKFCHKENNNQIQTPYDFGNVKLVKKKINEWNQKSLVEYNSRVECFLFMLFSKYQIMR